MLFGCALLVTVSTQESEVTENSQSQPGGGGQSGIPRVEYPLNLMCDCSCHADPEILLCRKCRSQHNIDELMALADSITFENDEVKRDFMRDWCGVGNA